MRPSSLLLILAAGWMVQGCAPGCERSCRKVLSCDGLDSDRVAVEECTNSCIEQATLYTGWADEEVFDEAFADHRRCLVRSSCDEIAAGECYDPMLFQVGVDPDASGTGLSGTSPTSTPSTTP